MPIPPISRLQLSHSSHNDPNWATPQQLNIGPHKVIRIGTTLISLSPKPRPLNPPLTLQLKTQHKEPKSQQHTYSTLATCRPPTQVPSCAQHLLFAPPSLRSMLHPAWAWGADLGAASCLLCPGALSQVPKLQPFWW